MEKKRSIESMERGHPVDASLFGSIGAMAAHVGEELAASFTGKRLAFMSIGQYQAIAGSGRLSEVNAIYWREILYRVYWASALDILRHQKWQAGCVRAFAPQANFLTFAAASVDCWRPPKMLGILWDQYSPLSHVTEPTSNPRYQEIYERRVS